MNQSLANIFGLFLSAALLICAFLAPRLFPATPAAGSPAALKAAEEARRQVAAFNEGVSRLAAQQDVESLKKADPEKLATIAKAELDERTRSIGEFINRARNTDRKSGLQAIRVNALSGDANLIRAGAENLDKIAAENSARLKAALTAAKAAVSEGSDAVGVGAMLALAYAVEASDQFAAARRLRTDWNDLRAEVLAAAADWTLTKTELDHYAGLSTKQAVEDLETDSNEFDALIAEAKKEADQLAAQIAERTQALEGVRVSLAQTRDELTRVEQQSFQAGNDSSFNTMKNALETHSRRLAELQEQEHLLVRGGMKGAKFADDETATGAIEGGEEVVGLEELERRHKVAADRLARLGRGKEALGKRMEDVGVYGKSASAEAARLTEQLVAEEKRAKAVLDRLVALNDEIVKQENLALAAVREAQKAIQRERKAVGGWMDQARTLKSYDPEGRNERLRMITSDEAARNLPEFAEAEINALLGRIYAEQVAGLESHRDIIERLTKVIKGSSKDLAKINETLDTARNEANTSLANAYAVYDKLANDNKFGWMARISAASVAASAAKVDPSKSSELTSSAANHIREAAKRAGRSWAFNIHYQMLRNWLAPGEPATDTQPAEGSGETPPATPPPGGGG